MKNSRKPLLSQDTSVLFATFSLWTSGRRMPTNGSVEPLRDFLVPRIKKLVLIDQLVPSSEDVLHKIEVYYHKKKTFISYKPSWWFMLLKPVLYFRNTNGTHISFKIRDFLSIMDWTMRDKTVFDYFIGLESINTLAGIVLRKFGRVKKVIYYVSDYSPNRYRNRWFNSLYLAFDRFSAKHADFIWDVSRAIQPARIKAGLVRSTSAPVIHVANGLFPTQIKISPLSQINPYSIVFMGTLGPENGPDVVIRALSIIRRRINEATLHIIGGTSESFEWLKPIIRDYKQTDAVIFHGFIPDAAKMSKIMRSCALAVAPYRSMKGSPRYYGDAGKIRAYCAAGLPIVSSRVPPLGKDMAEAGAAVLADDDEEGFADAILKIFSDKKLYMRMRNRAIEIARNNTWDHQFEQAFEHMESCESGKSFAGGV